MTTTIINGVGKRYLSELPEFSNGIPFGVVNKKLTDVGGTFCAINCKSNYIVVVPFKDLATSIECDVNNKYPVFKVFGGVTRTAFKNYISRNTTHKIAVTYDSLEKLTNWIVDDGIDLTCYKLLIDEYHLILEDMDFRDEAINKLLRTVTLYSHYSFLSATPINSNFEFEFLDNMPHYEVDFGATSKINPFRIKTPNVYKAAVALISQFKEGLMLDDIDGNVSRVNELHIFINSVNGIAQICKSAGLENDDVRIVCADRIRNGLVLGEYDISSVSEPNAPINFYTKKGFQGCNVFSNNALVVVISDARATHTLVDIETSLVQIVGRIRLNDFSKNIFRHKIYHIYSTNNRILTDDEFESFISEKKNESTIIYNDLMSKDFETRSVFIKRMNFESDFISTINGDIFINNRKEQLFRYKYELKKSYKDGLSIRDKYESSNKFLSGTQNYSEFDNILLCKLACVKLEDLYKLFLSGENKEMFDLEYPEFKEYRAHLTISEMNTLRWNKDKIDSLLVDKKAMKLVHTRVSASLKSGFISSKDLKSIYSNEIEKLGIGITPKATMIEDNNYIFNNNWIIEAEPSSSRVNDVKVKGYMIKVYTII